ncbi:MAG TPA: hypothetical protein VGS19_29285, partial [Streptosporangiaceae bacterium]|nr:hypothetical protein [Streptosporangiaceae bacterium]
MTLIAVAADKGAPGVSTTCVALAAVWPRPVLLAECDPAGGDLVYRFPSAAGPQLDPQRGLLSLAVAARRGLGSEQVWQHTQKLRGGLDVLVGVVTPEQGVGLESLWGPMGAAMAGLPQADVIADCGRIGVDGPHFDLLAHASMVLLVTRARLEEVVRLRERVTTLGTALARRDRTPWIGAAVVAPHREFHSAVAEVSAALGQQSGGRRTGQAAPRRPGAQTSYSTDYRPGAGFSAGSGYGGLAGVLGGLAFEPRSAEQLRGQWGGGLDRSLLIRTARDLAGRISAYLSSGPIPASAGPPGTHNPPSRPAPTPTTPPGGPA